MALSVVLGIGITCVSALLLRVPIVAIFALGVVLPAGAVWAVVGGSDGFGPPLAVLAISSAVYAGVVYAMIATVGRRMAVARMRRLALWLVLPVASAGALASDPDLNPLWPVGLAEARAERSELRSRLEAKFSSEEARNMLESISIEVHEEIAPADKIVLRRGSETVIAMSGERVMFARYPTSAREFPCGYEMEIVLVFGKDDRLKQRHVDLLRVCP